MTKPADSPGTVLDALLGFGALIWTGLIVWSATRETGIWSYFNDLQDMIFSGNHYWILNIFLIAGCIFIPVILAGAAVNRFKKIPR